MRLAFRLILGAFLSFASISRAFAQQPFVVDDAEVTSRRASHLEIANQIDFLRAAARPARWQNAFDVEFAWGAAERLEVSAIAPLISLASETPIGRRVDTGIGDVSLAAKFRFTADQARHAWAGSIGIEIPSGDRDRQLGSGLVDYALNIVTQHRLDEKWTARVNCGLVLAGNTQIGAVGIKERGTVVTAGSSLIKGIGHSSQAGAEVIFAWSQKATLSGSLLAVQAGGNVALRPGWTVDIGIGTGWFDASPRLSAQVGLSIDVTASRP